MRKNKKQPIEMKTDFINYGMDRKKSVKGEGERADENIMFCQRCADSVGMTYGKFMSLEPSQRMRIADKLLSKNEASKEKGGSDHVETIRANH